MDWNSKQRVPLPRSTSFWIFFFTFQVTADFAEYHYNRDPEIRERHQNVIPDDTTSQHSALSDGLHLEPARLKKLRRLNFASHKLLLVVVVTDWP